MTTFRIGEERHKIEELLHQPVDAMECRVIKWAGNRARRINDSQIFPSLGVDLQKPNYDGQQEIREIDDNEKPPVEVTLLFTGYDIPGCRAILGVTKIGTEVQALELRKFGENSFPSHLQNLNPVI